MLNHCSQCKKEYLKERYNKGNFCSRTCYWASMKGIVPQGGKIAGSRLGHPLNNAGKETMSAKMKGNAQRFNKGEKHPNYINGYTIPFARGFYSQQWAKRVKSRDGNKCKISNAECKGRLEAHHILGWDTHPELRFELNNGITLCSLHHPRSRVLEIQKVDEFKKLINNK